MTREEVIEKLNVYKREIAAWNIKACRHSDNELNIICTKIEKTINMFEDIHRYDINELRKTIKETYMMLDKYVLTDSSKLAQTLTNCLNSADSVYENYIFRDELYFYKELCVHLNINYISKVIELENKFLASKELPF